MEARAHRTGRLLSPVSHPDIGDGYVGRADVVVVGSGAGGAAAAKELAEAGLSVAVLEEGPYVTSEAFDAPPWERFIRLCRDGGMTVAVGKPLIPMPLGRAVGGTTLVNSGTCFRTPRKVLDEWASAHGIPGLDPAHDGPDLRARRRGDLGSSRAVGADRRERAPGPQGGAGPGAVRRADPAQHHRLPRVRPVRVRVSLRREAGDAPVVPAAGRARRRAPVHGRAGRAGARPQRGLARGRGDDPGRERPPGRPGPVRGEGRGGGVPAAS